MSMFFSIEKEARKKYTTDFNMSSAYFLTKLGLCADKNISESMKDVPVVKFTIDTLNDLKSIVEKIEF